LSWLNYNWSLSRLRNFNWCWRNHSFSWLWDFNWLRLNSLLNCRSFIWYNYRLSRLLLDNNSLNFWGWCYYLNFRFSRINYLNWSCCINSLIYRRSGVYNFNRSGSINNLSWSWFNNNRACHICSLCHRSWLNFNWLCALSWYHFLNHWYLFNLC
jgi:hypothetical protein